MRRRAGAFAAALLVAAATPADALVGPMRPRCIVADTVVVSKLDSRKTVAGDYFIFKVVGMVPASRDLPRIVDGTRGYGVVSFAQHAGPNGQPGRLVLEARFLELADGRRVSAIRDPRLDDGIAEGARRNAPDALGFVPVVGWAVVGGYNALHRGREVDIKPGTPMRVVLGDDLALGRCTDPPASDFP